MFFSQINSCLVHGAIMCLQLYCWFLSESEGTRWLYESTIKITFFFTPALAFSLLLTKTSNSSFVKPQPASDFIHSSVLIYCKTSGFNIFSILDICRYQAWSDTGSGGPLILSFNILHDQKQLISWQNNEKRIN